MTAQLSVRPFHARDEDAVLHLLAESLGETETLQRTREWFAWKHLDNPFGQSIMLVAEDSRGVVGFRAFMRWQMNLTGGDTLRCVRAVDTATHPRARRRGVFRRLTEDAVDLATASGVDLIFNTPNPRSGAGYLTMGWQEVGSIGVMIRPTFRFGRKSGNFPSVPGAHGWDARSVTDRAPLGLRTPRTAEYMQWRFGSHPTVRYTVVAAGAESFAVLRSNLRRGRAELVVSDLFGPDGGSAVRKAAHNTDAAYLAGWFPRGTPERRQALRSGLFPAPFVKALTLFARPLRPLEVEVSRLGNWDISLGDLELL